MHVVSIAEALRPASITWITPVDLFYAVLGSMYALEDVEGGGMDNLVDWLGQVLSPTTEFLQHLVKDESVPLFCLHSLVHQL